MTDKTPYKAVREWHEIRMSTECGKRHVMDECMDIVGLTRLHVGKIPPKFKQRMIAAVRRGYTTAQRGLWPAMLQFICEEVHNPIGYIGRTHMNIWIPQDDKFGDRMEALRAFVALTGDFKLKSKAHGRTEHAFKQRKHCKHTKQIEIVCDLNYGLADTMEKYREGVKEPQLLPYLKNVRHHIEEMLKETRPVRESLIDYLHSDAIISIPFTTRGKKGIIV